MKTFKSHLETKLKDERFKELYEEERHLLTISLKLAETRKRLKLSQKELAEKAKITQQQVSRIEQGMNCNVVTFLRVCDALGVKLDVDDTNICA